MLNKGRRRLLLIIGAIVVLAVVLFLIFVRSSGDNEVVSAETVTAFIGDLSASATASGQVTPRRETTISVDQPGLVKTVAVRPGDRVHAGDALMVLDTSDLALDVASAEQNLRLQEANLADLLKEPTAAELASAQAAVASAQAQLDEILNGPSAEELAAQEADLRAAEANVWSSSAQVGQVQNTIKPADIAAAEAAVKAAEADLLSVEIEYTRNPDEDDIIANTSLAEARNKLASAQAQLDLLLTGPDQNELGNAQAGLSATSAQRDATQAQLSALIADPSAAELAGAKAQLAQAEASLENLLSGATAEQIAAAEAEVEQARINLEDAEDILDSATLTAPFDGVVTAVNYSQGEFASGPAIELIDNTLLKVVLEVDEIDIGAMKVGQPAVLSLETWPDIALESEIIAIAPQAKNAPDSNLVVYEVQLGLGETDLPVRVGMTANADLVTSQGKDVLLVPNQAIDVDRTKGTYSVMVSVGESFEEVPVTIGLRDSQFTQITSGLKDGDELLIGNSVPLQRAGEGGPGFFGGEDEE
jgi:HlyD family secretion protein